MNIDERMKDILRILIQHNGKTTSETLAIQLGISARTVRKCIALHKKTLSDYGIMIVTKGRKGLEMKTNGNDISYLLQNDSIIPDNQESRLRYLMQYLLMSNEYVKLDDIAEAMSISRSTMNRLFKDAKLKLYEYHLEVRSKPSYGMKIVGSELQKRLCLVQFCIPPYQSQLHSFFKQLGNKAYEEEKIIRALILNTLEQYNFRMTEVGYNNLVLHLLVSLYRIRSNQDIGEQLELSKTCKEYQIAVEIANRMEKEFTISMSESEIDYLQIHLMGKQILDQKDLPMITKQVETLVNNCNIRIKECLGYDFQSDFELFTLLAVHMIPLLTRIEFGLDMPNPMLTDIKMHLFKGYECAVIVSQVLEEETGNVVSEGELGYLAMHYALALERLNEQRNARQILLICPSGMGTSRLLMHRLVKQYNIQEENMKVIDMRELKEIDLSTIDYIISTVPIPFEVNKPIIYMNNVFEDIHTETIEKKESNLKFLTQNNIFLNKSYDTKEEVIDFLCNHIEKNYNIDKTLRNYIYQREEISSTIVGNAVALPHPISLCTTQSIVCLMTLKRPVNWGQDYVKLVFLVSGNCHNRKDSEQINDQIIKIIMQPEAIQNICKSKTYQELVRNI